MASWPPRAQPYPNIMNLAHETVVFILVGNFHLTAKDKLIAANRYHEKIVDQCVDKGMTFEERQAARQASFCARLYSLRGIEDPQPGGLSCLPFVAKRSPEDIKHFARTLPHWIEQLAERTWLDQSMGQLKRWRCVHLSSLKS
eukprot:2908320-Amphidinium_carterae.1